MKFFVDTADVKEIHELNDLGLLDGEADAIYLLLNRGDNELLLAVTEYFGGWGFLGRLDSEAAAASSASVSRAEPARRR